MSKSSLIDFQVLGNAQVEAELGRRLKRRRVELGLNQSEVAANAGLARRTISSVENGEGCSLGTFIAMLRALGALPELEAILPDPGPSPIALTIREAKTRKNPYKPRGRKKDAPWQWGDEKQKS